MQHSTLSADALLEEAVSHPFQDSQVARLTSAFMDLDEEHRLVLCLHYLERLNLEQIAAVLDDSPENVETVYREAIVRLGGSAERQRDAA